MKFLGVAALLVAMISSATALPAANALAVPEAFPNPLALPVPGKDKGKGKAPAPPPPPTIHWNKAAHDHVTDTKDHKNIPKYEASAKAAAAEAIRQGKVSPQADFSIRKGSHVDPKTGKVDPGPNGHPNGIKGDWNTLQCQEPGMKTTSCIHVALDKNGGVARGAHVDLHNQNVDKGKTAVTHSQNKGPKVQRRAFVA
ncbi:hypothetical protein K461DRAFT_103019 [Myriangium duriaei CBS 260.36]|uniref:Uncharacterized protein n=1 Tax=Myriangium duriaei CBS 260.36 TaxID=1168546 RepID=A0A9P4J7G1_9PEZI|nr:hypothetical protein K461DRAFT_103019 [Myriangium duriaei CBS 260.36]